MRTLFSIVALTLVGSFSWSQTREGIRGATSIVEVVETYSVPVKAHARLGFGNEAGPAAGLVVEFGVGAGGEHKRYFNSVALGRFTCDARGRLAGTLEVPVSWKDEPEAVLWSRIAVPGFMHLIHKQKLAAHKPDSVRELRAIPGSTLYGRALDSAGQPVLGATVWLKAEGVLRPLKSTSGEGGLFWVNYKSPGIYRLHLRGEVPGQVAGSATLLGLTLESDAPEQEITMILGGGQALRGRVLDSTGSPVPGLRILALPKGAWSYPSDQACLLAEQQGGLLTGSARTNRKGEFVIDALVDGVYDLHVKWLEGSSQDGEARYGWPRDKRWGGGTRLAGKALGTWVGSYVLAEQGEPLGLVYDCQRIEVEYEQSPTAPLLHHFELQAINGADSNDWGWAAEPILMDGLAIFPIKAQKDYVLVWNQPGLRYQEWAVSAAWGQQLISIEMPPAKSFPPIKLRIRVLDPGGTPCLHDPLISILAPDSKREICSSFSRGMLSFNEVTNAEWSTELAPGRVLIQVEDTPIGGGCWISSPLERPVHLLVEREVILRSGQDEFFELRMGSAGNLNLRSRQAPNGPSREQLHALHEERRFSKSRIRAREHFGGGELVLFDSHGQQLAAMSFEVLHGVSPGPSWGVPGWDMNCLDPLAPGAYTLRVVRAGSVIFEEQLVVQKDKETTLWW